jgi:hypothetical protein
MNVNVNPPTAGAGDNWLASITATLTDAAYAVALRHGVSGSWIDLQLELWRVLTEAIESGGSPPASRLDECNA